VLGYFSVGSACMSVDILDFSGGEMEDSSLFWSGGIPLIPRDWVARTWR
jgi:hypothetical protein